MMMMVQRAGSTIARRSAIGRSVRKAMSTAPASLYFTPDLDTDEIVIAEHAHSTMITLNKPKTLNSLTLDMIRQLYPALKRFDEHSGAYTCILQGTGKAFCAGGDVKALYHEWAKTGKRDHELGKAMFKEEYTLNHLIATMKSNCVAIMDGITMGGGVGLSWGARFRIATENTVWAMPETAIGFFPDVGASYFLGRMPGNLGMYLGLTGASLRSGDAVHAGVATNFVMSHRLVPLIDRLHEIEYDPASVEFAIREHACKPNPSSIAEFLPLIDECFGKASVEEIVASLRDSKSSFGTAVADKLGAMCPLSLKVAFKEIRTGKSLTIEQCFQMEYRLSQHFMNGPDFYEGVRAALIDKDRNPKWQRPSLKAVSDASVDRYFAPVPEELKLTGPGSA